MTGQELEWCSHETMEGDSHPKLELARGGVSPRAAGGGTEAADTWTSTQRYWFLDFCFLFSDLSTMTLEETDGTVREFLLFEATASVVICYSSHRRLIPSLT